MLIGASLLLVMVLWVSLGTWIVYGTNFADYLADRFGIFSVILFWLLWNIPSVVLIAYGLTEVFGLW